MNTRDQETFFQDPSIVPNPPGNFGILYLLRRDIRRCMDNKILWPGAMSILAGVDLLGKFRAGDESAGVGTRFKGFISAYFHVSPSDGDAIYELRNALLHSFGLISKTKKGPIYRFQLDFGTNTTLVSLSHTGSYLVDILSLQTHFENAVEEYRQDVLASPDLQTKFAAMYPDYGAIPITL